MEFKVGEGRGKILLGDNLPILCNLDDELAQLIYIDPPFNTGRIQSKTGRITTEDSAGERKGFRGRNYKSDIVSQFHYPDIFTDYLAFLEPRLIEARRILKSTGTLYFHVDYRESAYCKILLDEIFGRSCFLNEIILAYDYGSRTKKRWPTKHENILVYVKDPLNYYFDSAEVDREPYMAPGLIGPEKLAKGKLPTDVWWHTIVSPTGYEKTGYPTQKPVGVLKRIVTASSREDDLVLDFFAGSGTTGDAALQLGRRFLLIDSNPEAVEIMIKRFGV